MQRGDIIADVETDKADIEVEVFTTGVIEKFLVQPGEKVPVGTVLAIIREEGKPLTPEALRIITATAREPIPAMPAAPRSFDITSGNAPCRGRGKAPHLSSRKKACGRARNRPGFPGLGRGPEAESLWKTSSRRRKPKLLSQRLR